MLAPKIVAPVTQLPRLLLHSPKFRYISSKPLEDYKKSLLLRQPKISSLKLHTYCLGKTSWVWLKQGTLDAWRDLKTYRHIKSTPAFSRTATQTMQYHRIKLDLLKLIPFSFFVVVPFSELVLPFYLYFLPNSTPTCYRFDSSRIQEMKVFEGKRDTAYRYFINKLKSEGNFKLDDIQPMELRKKLAQGESKGTSIYNMSSEELMMLCDFLGVREYMTGTNIINRTVNLLSYYLPTLLYTPWNMITRKSKDAPAVNWGRFLQYKDLPICKLNFGPFETLKRRFLLAQISKHIKNVKKVDTKLLTDGTVQYGPQTLEEFNRARGITRGTTQSPSSDILKKQWLTFSTDPKIDLNQTILYSLLLHHYLHLSTAH